MKKLLITLVIFCFPYIAFAAVAFDTATAGAPFSQNPSFSFTTTGSNRVLIVWKSSINGTGLTATYNGVSMTQVAQAAPTAPCNAYNTAFYLANPTSGANTVQFGGDDANGTNYYVAASYTGVDQGSSPDNTHTHTQGTGTTNSDTITPVGSNAWHVAAFESGSAGQSASVGTQRAVTTAAFGVYDTNGIASSPDTLTVNQTNQCGTAVGVTIIPPATTAALQTSILGLVRAFWIR